MTPATGSRRARARLGTAIVATSAAIAAAIPAGAAAVKPTPGGLQTFGSWTVGCDNIRSCTAASLNLNPDLPNIHVRISRGAKGDAAPSVRIAADRSMRVGSVAIDGQSVPFASTPASLQGAAGAASVAAMLRGTEIAVTSDLSDTPMRISTNGLSAALKWMDDAQKRTDTATALVTPGAKPASAVPAPPSAPTVRALRIAATKPVALNDAQRAKADALAGCHQADTVAAGYQPEISTLPGGKSLLLWPCSSGGYYVSSVPLIVSGTGAAWKVVLAAFDYVRSGPGGQPTLTNPDVDAAARALTEDSPSRAEGDCGVFNAWAWDGSMFRLVESAVMDQCGGVIEWIAVWQAKSAKG